MRLFGTPSLGVADNPDPFIPYIPSGEAAFTGSPSRALFDGRDDTYATIYTGQADVSIQWLDVIVLPVLTTVDSVEVRWSFEDPPEQIEHGREIELFRNDTLGPFLGSYSSATPGVIEDVTVELSSPLLAGDTLVISGPGLVTPGVKQPTTVYQVGPVVTGIPPLRLYPRHDKRLFPPTRSRGIRPTGYP